VVAAMSIGAVSPKPSGTVFATQSAIACASRALIQLAEPGAYEIAIRESSGSRPRKRPGMSRRRGVPPQRPGCCPRVSRSGCARCRVSGAPRIPRGDVDGPRSRTRSSGRSGPTESTVRRRVPRTSLTNSAAWRRLSSSAWFPLAVDRSLSDAGMLVRTRTAATSSVGGHWVPPAPKSGQSGGLGRSIPASVSDRFGILDRPLTPWLWE
jgi:hypothetical protein